MAGLRVPSRRTALTLLGLGLVWGVATTIAGPLPGDVAITRAAQALASPDADWARLATATGKMPLLAALAALCAGVAAWLAGWRAGLGVLLSLGLAKLVEFGLRAVVHAPRPSADLVQVISPSASSGFPSTFGLVHGATVGFLLLAALGSGRRGSGWISISALLALLLGVLARIVPGGHWPSQMLASSLLGLGVSALVLRLLLGGGRTATR